MRIRIWDQDGNVLANFDVDGNEISVSAAREGAFLDTRIQGERVVRIQEKSIHSPDYNRKSEVGLMVTLS